MKVTISDVARLAGVSTATVSHTINSTRYVSGETKEKVYRAIAELGYTPDASARSFRSGSFWPKRPDRKEKNHWIYRSGYFQ